MRPPLHLLVATARLQELAAAIERLGGELEAKEQLVAQLQGVHRLDLLNHVSGSCGSGFL